MVRSPRAAIWLAVLMLCLAGCSSKSATPAVTGSALRGNDVVVIHQAKATVSGTATTVLTNTDGFTLYYRTSDKIGSVCSGQCSVTWPALVLNSGRPSATPTVEGELAMRTDINGRQVIIGGHPLYTYAGDKQAGDASGNGVGGIWFAATPELGADEG